MNAWQALLQLDYGGFNDSANQKVSVGSATLLAAGREQDHFNFFFNQSKSKNEPTMQAGRAKKDAQTGIYFIGEMLDPMKSPEGNGVSLFEKHYPETNHLTFSGDTGNGYRSYAMLEELSAVCGKYSYTVELACLAPGHV